jgi:hypothetical protein
MITRRVALPLLLVLLTGCRAVPTISAPPQVVTTLYFGLGLQDGTTLSDTDWNAFVEQEILPRFPDGFTIQSADGHWEHEGKSVHEPSRLFSVVHPADAATDAKLEALRTLYCRQFKQDAVLRIDQPTSRVSF